MHQGYSCLHHTEETAKQQVAFFTCGWQSNVHAAVHVDR